jgi:outer membrane protein assembly factor BamB
MFVLTAVCNRTQTVATFTALEDPPGSSIYVCEFSFPSTLAVSHDVLMQQNGILTTCAACNPGCNASCPHGSGGDYGVAQSYQLTNAPWPTPHGTVDRKSQGVVAISPSCFITYVQSPYGATIGAAPVIGAGSVVALPTPTGILFSQNGLPTALQPLPSSYSLVSPVVVAFKTTFSFIATSAATMSTNLFIIAPSGIVSNATLPSAVLGSAELVMSTSGIYFYSNSAVLVANNGLQVQWQVVLSGPIVHLAQEVATGILVATVANGQVFGLNNVSGIIIWKYSISDGSRPNALALGNSLAIIGTPTQTIAINITAGEVVWTNRAVACTQAIASTAVCEVVCVSNSSGSLSLVAMNASTQLVSWTTSLPSNITQADVVVDHNGTAIAGWSDGTTATVVAYKSGVKIWPALAVPGTGIKLAIDGSGNVIVLTYGSEGQLYTLGELTRLRPSYFAGESGVPCAS